MVDVFQFVLTGRSRRRCGIWDIPSSFERGLYNENNSFYLLYNYPPLVRARQNTRSRAHVCNTISSDCLRHHCSFPQRKNNTRYYDNISAPARAAIECASDIGAYRSVLYVIVVIVIYNV